LSSSGDNLKRWLRGADASQAKSAGPGKPAPRTSRRCIGLGELLRNLQSTGERKICVLDLGPTSPANIAFITGMGARVFNEDILRESQDPSYTAKREDGSVQIDPAKFFAENLNYAADQFDAILCWDVPDYLPESLVKPLVERLQVMLRVKGNLLAFFHTKDAGPESLYSRHHIVPPDVLELEPIQGFRLQRIFNNRHIENLFKDFASRKFFLGRDNIREVLMVR
jgi:hypothetical protein